MFFDLFDNIVNCDKKRQEGIKLEEVLTKTEINRMKDELATPEILPCGFDVSIPGWLERIRLWGKIEIYHKDPENFWGKKKTTERQFLNAISNDELNKLLGQWRIEKKKMTKVSFYRDYLDIKGKSRREEFIISVKLRKELR